MSGSDNSISQPLLDSLSEKSPFIQLFLRFFLQDTQSCPRAKIERAIELRKNVLKTLMVGFILAAISAFVFSVFFAISQDAHPHPDQIQACIHAALLGGLCLSLSLACLYHLSDSRYFPVKKGSREETDMLTLVQYSLAARKYYTEHMQANAPLRYFDLDYMLKLHHDAARSQVSLISIQPNSTTE